MRQHTKEFKNEIQKNGRQLDSKIIIKGSELVLGAEDLFSVTPVTNSTLLKSVMKEVDFESKQQIGVGQEINVKSGIKVGNEYEYIDYGNYFVYKSEYRAETDSYSHICYDKMLKTMIDYTPLDITYPINLREYITAIATKCGLEFADKNSTFANYNTSINEDHFSNGNYTFRDVLDYIAQLVGGWFCINDNDELEIRYPELARNYDKVSGESISFISNAEDKINTIIVDGKSTQETRSGKNKAKINDFSTTIKGIEITCINGEITFNGTANADIIRADFINYCGLFDLPKGTYTFSTTYVSGGRANASSFAKTITNRNTSVAIFTNNDSTNTQTQTTTEDTICYVGFSISADSIFNNYKIKLQLESGTNTTDWEQFGVMPSPDYPSEVECIEGTIQIRNVGKNLFDKDNANLNKGINTSNGFLYSSSSQFSTDFIDISKYSSISTNGKSNNKGSLYGTLYDKNKTYLESISSSTETLNIKNSNAKYIRLTFYNTYLDNLMINEGSDVAEYEPYKENITLIDLKDNELCSIGDVKDELVIKDDRAKIIKKIGKYIANNDLGSNGMTETTVDLVSPVLPIAANLTAAALNKVALSNLMTGTIIQNTGLNGTTSASKIRVSLSTNYASSYAEASTYLTTNNFTIYYVLTTPTEIDLGEVDILSTFDGANNISLNATLNTNMSITYTNDFEELDKHFLKDVNVSFMKKYGAINSVVFSRGGGSDNIYRKDNASINKNGLTEIKIADNPFLEGDDRENFIQPLFDKINGLEFYLMDVNSTGIMYLELGDLYYFNMIEDKPSLKSGLVKSGLRKAQGSSGGKFLCLLMNDEIKITQGLEESIYNDEPEITETDYKTASITDTSIKNAIIQTNKNSAEILLKVNSDEVVSAINLSPESIKISSAKLDVDAIATFTNSKLAEAGSTVINGANITTGTLSANRISGGTISASTIDLKGTVLTPTSSSIGGLNVESGIISNDRMGLDTVNGVVKVFNVNGGSMILSNAARLSATAGIGLTSNSTGVVPAPTTNLDLKACSGAEAYLGSMINADGTGERSGITCSNGVLSFRSTGYCTYNGTTVFGSSSKATKENIEDLSQEQKEEVYQLIKNIPTKQYDYKKEYGKPFNYGFIIEDIENTKLKELLHITQAENNKDIKMYSTEDLVRLQLIVIQELMRKVETLEKKESENNAEN